MDGLLHQQTKLLQMKQISIMIIINQTYHLNCVHVDLCQFNLLLVS